MAPALGLAALCRVETPGSDPMACCHAMAERCMKHGAQPAPARDSDCCRHDVSAPVPVAWMSANGGPQTLQWGCVFTLPAGRTAPMYGRQPAQTASLPPPLPPAADRLGTVLLI